MAIYKAIEHLPEHLVTQAIVDAAVIEGDINLLSVLPKSFVTEAIVNTILDKNMDSYNKFNLDNIPENCRTEAVYTKAVKDRSGNFSRVPEQYKNRTMLEYLLSGFTDNLWLLPQIPSALWDKERVYKAVKSLYGYSYSSSYSRGRYNSSTIGTDNIKKVQIFLYHLPKEIKTAGFYKGLFDQTSMSVQDIDLITPKCFKRLSYYQCLAQQDFNLIPESMYTYDMLMIFIQPDSKLYLNNLYENKIVKAKFDELMDDSMANAVIRKDPWYFEKLPEAFRTEKRLLFAIGLMNAKHYRSVIISEDETNLLTAKVCRALVKKGFGYPKFPAKIWTQDFVDYCMEHSPNDDWFEQMPSQFQTLEIAEKMLDFTLYNARHIDPQFISEKRAKQLFRDNNGYGNNYREYTPKHYLTAFEQLTGLPEYFFGGEVPFSKLKEEHKDYTYSKMGDFYVGFYNAGSSWKPDYRLTVTRRNPMKFTPEQVFDHYVGTFHPTWLEKQVSEFCGIDKIALPKEQKKFQHNTYYSVKKAGSENGIDMYENRFLGATVCFAAEIGDEVYFRNDKEDLFEKINQYETAC